MFHAAQRSGEKQGNLSMNAMTLGLIDAISAAKRPARKGALYASFTVRGVEIELTYDSVGRYMPATRDDPAEGPELTIVTIQIGGCAVYGEDFEDWLDRLNLETELAEHLAREWI